MAITKTVGVKPKKLTRGSVTSVAIIPYNRRSKGYRELTKALDLAYPTITDLEQVTMSSKLALNTLINWGSGNIPGWLQASTKKILNTTGAVNICRNKIKFFNAVKDTTRIPEFTQDLETALQWVRDGVVTMGRKQTGSCGTDIVFYEDNPAAFQESDFWVQYKKKKTEFRVHIFDGNVISLQQKAIRTSDEQGQAIPSGTIDFRIRNHRNGFIFKRNEISVPDDVTYQALSAVTAIPGLTFGAVDVIYNQYEGRAYVLEVNTAPGLEGTTLEDYTKAFKNFA